MLVHGQALISPSWCAGGEDEGKKERLTTLDTLTVASLPVLLLSSSHSIRGELEHEAKLCMLVSVVELEACQSQWPSRRSSSRLADCI